MTRRQLQRLRKKRKIQQKIAGVVLIALSVAVMIYMKGEDCGALLFTIAIGLWIFFTKEVVFYV